MTTKLMIPDDRFAQPQAENATSAGTLGISEKFRLAIESPTDFPALKDVVFEGDSVAVAVLNDLNNPSASLEGLLDSLVDNNLPASKLRIVSAFELNDFSDEKRNMWDQRFEEKGTELSFVVHDPDDQYDVAYMAASFAGDPIYVNRSLFDADMIIPLTSPSKDNPEFEKLLYPEFSTAETKTRFLDPESNPESLRSEVRHANELVGASFVVSSIPGVGGTVAKVLAGDPSSISKLDNDSVEGWHLSRLPEGKLVVATIEADGNRQNWSQFFQALTVAAMAADNTEQIVVCSQLSELPQGIQEQVLQLQFESDYEKINQIQQTLPATLRHIPGILEEMSVFLKSNLSESEVEDLGFGFIENDDRLQRIVDNAESGIILRDAHLCTITG